jgi:hypothetical protein
MRKNHDPQQPALDFNSVEFPRPTPDSRTAEPIKLSDRIRAEGGMPYFHQELDSINAFLLPISTVKTLAEHKPVLIQAWIEAKKLARQLASNSVTYENRLTKKEALGVGSSAYAVAEHATDYPSALGFLKFTVSRIVEHTAKVYGRGINSISVALAYSDATIDIFNQYASGTIFAQALEPELIDKFRNDKKAQKQLIKEASRSYIQAALKDTSKPLHPATRALALAINSIKSMQAAKDESAKNEKFNVVFITPTFEEAEQKTQFNEEYRLAKQELIPEEKSKISIKRIDSLPQNPIIKVSIVVLGDECSPSQIPAIQQKFPDANIIFLNKEESQPKEGQNSLFGQINEPPKWHHGMDPEPKRRRTKQ